MCMSVDIDAFDYGSTKSLNLLYKKIIKNSIRDRSVRVLHDKRTSISVCVKIKEKLWNNSVMLKIRETFKKMLKITLKS